MSRGKSRETVDWYVEADHAAGARLRETYRARLDEERANSLGIIVTMCLLFVLFASALMVGGRAIAPLLHYTVAAREEAGTGDIVVRMPDGVFCRHMSFDNTTADITQGAVERCPSAIAAGRGTTGTKFEWGTTR